MAPFLLLTSSIGKACGVRAKSVDRGSAEQGSSDICSNSPVHGVDTGSSDSDSNAVNSAATGSSNRDGGLGPGVGDTESSNSDSIGNNVTSREPFASNEYSRVTNNLVETYAKNNSEALTELDFEDCTALTNRALWAISYCTSGRGIKRLCIRNCRAITDDGLLAFATEKVKINEIDVRGVENLTLAAATRLIFECEARLVLPIKLDQLVQKICVGEDPRTVLQTALGKTLLFLEAQPSATAFTVPYEEGNTPAEVQSLLLRALNGLTNLTTGGLQLHESYTDICIDFMLPGADVHKWPQKYFDVVCSVPQFTLALASLNLSNANLDQQGLSKFAEGFPRWTKLRELNVFKCFPNKA